MFSGIIKSNSTLDWRNHLELEQLLLVEVFYKKKWLNKVKLPHKESYIRKSSFLVQLLSGWKENSECQRLRKALEFFFVRSVSTLHTRKTNQVNVRLGEKRTDFNLRRSSHIYIVWNCTRMNVKEKEGEWIIFENRNIEKFFFPHTKDYQRVACCMKIFRT